jgi:hypothetical protein
MLLYIAHLLSLPVSAGTHRRPLRSRLYGPLVAVLASLLTLAVLFAVHVLVWYHGVNAGFVLHIPFTSGAFNVGYEYRGVPGFFRGDF